MLNGVIDISHYQEKVDFAAAKQAGILAVIHKATEGTGYVDQAFAAHTAASKDAGLLIGAYHYGTSGDGARQADAFLKVTRGVTGLLVLDWEHPSMTKNEAVKFVSRIHDQTGRWPGLYSFGPFLRQYVGSEKDPVLLNCWLWCARYGGYPSWPKTTWPTLTMWQYTNGKVGNGTDPTSTPGIGNCDRNIFYGTENDLRSLFTHSSPAPMAFQPDEAQQNAFSDMLGIGVYSEETPRTQDNYEWAVRLKRLFQAGDKRWLRLDGTNKPIA